MLMHVDTAFALAHGFFLANTNSLHFVLMNIFDFMYT